MVGNAIRHASNGLGGRPQQILAVTLTYFAISTSYIPVMIYQYWKSPAGRQRIKTGAEKQTQPEQTAPMQSGERNRGVSSDAFSSRTPARSGWSVPRPARRLRLRSHLALHPLHRHAARLAHDGPHRHYPHRPLRGRRTMSCPSCATDLEPAALSCPQCRRLTHVRRTRRPRQTRQSRMAHRQLR